MEQNKEVENLKQQIKELDAKVQAKAAEKARIASETAQKATQTSIPQKVANAVAPVAQASGGDAQALIIHWAGVYGVDANWLLRVAKCESGFNPSSVNHGYYAGGGNPSGIFQFLPQTFYANAARAGIAGADLWNVDQQAHTAAYMFSIGQSGQWACK